MEKGRRGDARNPSPFRKILELKIKQKGEKLNSNQNLKSYVCSSSWDWLGKYVEEHTDTCTVTINSLDPVDVNVVAIFLVYRKPLINGWIADKP